jgi:D-sedoheptulose 7-phosphate isomerase
MTWAALAAGRSVVTIGNGGGAATASHCAADLAAAIADCAGPAHCGQVRSLASDCATVTALANDFGVDDMFARQVRGAVRTGDVLLCYSVSGRSANVLRACAQARSAGGTSIAFVGRAPAAPHAIDLCVELPGVFYGSIEDAQQCATHMLAAYVHGAHKAIHRRVG